MLGLKLNHVSEIGHWKIAATLFCPNCIKGTNEAHLFQPYDAVQHASIVTL